VGPLPTNQLAKRASVMTVLNIKHGRVIMKLVKRLKLLKEKDKKPDIKQVVQILPHGKGWIVNGKKVLK
jgi:rRNA processing protein Krr1/Pno1